MPDGGIIKMKKLCSLGIALLLMLTVTFTATATSVTVPYENYTYSADGSVIVSPQAYLPETVIYGHDLGIDDFKNATDIDCDSEGLLYILDEEDNKVIVLKNDLTLDRVIKIKQTLKDGTEISLSDAQGITVTDDKIYICDTENSRMLVFDKKSGKYINMITTPKSKALEEGFIFKPIKASIDEEGNYYIVSNGTYEGIVNLDAKGEFLGFFAANEATASAWELFWRRFSTVEQRKKSIQFVPQDLSSVDIDEFGFFFVTSRIEQNNSMVKRVNPGGNDVIRNISGISIVGDIGVSKNDVSSFIDVTAGKYKIYACLDSIRGKIFCYNNDGYLIYTFGAISDQKGGFSVPSAITYLNDERIAVLDNRMNSVTVFSPTEYAKNINIAINLNNQLKYDDAVDEWRNVLAYNQNYEFAQNMIGNSYYNSGDYKQALYYYKQAHNKEMYSTVKEAIRKDWLDSYLTYIVIGVIALIVLVYVIKFIKWRKNPNKKPKKEE